LLVLTRMERRLAIALFRCLLMIVETFFLVADKRAIRTPILQDLSAAALPLDNSKMRGAGFRSGAGIAACIPDISRHG
jgi:hypothetical protein